MSLSKLQEMVKDREAQHAAVYGVAKNWTWFSGWTTADWIKRITCPKVNGPYPTSWRHEQSKKNWGRRNSFCLTAFQQGHCFFSLPLNSRWNTGSSNLPALDLNTTFCWVFSLPTSAPGTSQSSKLGESIPYEKISFYTHCIGAVSLENSNTALLRAFSDLAPLPLEHDTWSLHLQLTTTSSPEPCILCRHSLEW